MKDETAVNEAGLHLRPGEYWIRKRDKMLCTVEAVSRSTVDYCTRPLLVVYTTSKAAFLKNFRWEGVSLQRYRKVLR